MKIFSTVSDLRQAVQALAIRQQKIGFVPTMGALHQGHGALIAASAEKYPFTLVSIFVNPTQFGPNEDFSRYPRTLEADVALAEKYGAQAVFTPAVDEVYPPNHRTEIEVTGLSSILCGKYRPGHFRGVATVVHRLFKLVQPQAAFFGLKDLQQCLVVRRMCEDLDIGVNLEFIPTVREPDGLAMSSRNRYLSNEERRAALVISRALQKGKIAFDQGVRSCTEVEQILKSELAKEPLFQMQYAEVCQLPNLEKVDRIDGSAAALIAGYIGKTRLIDNIQLA